MQLLRTIKEKLLIYVLINNKNLNSKKKKCKRGMPKQSPVTRSKPTQEEAVK